MVWIWQVQGDCKKSSYFGVNFEATERDLDLFLYPRFRNYTSMGLAFDWTHESTGGRAHMP